MHQQIQVHRPSICGRLGIFTLLFLSPVLSVTAPYLAQAAERGISDAEILAGATQSLSGEGAPGKVSANIVLGVETYFRKVNAQGGVYGRKLRYIVRDSKYQMPIALEMTKKLVEEDKVFALISPLGTPAMVATRPFINRVGLPLIAPVDGDNRSRFPVNPSIFYLRASFEQEALATLDLIHKEYHSDEFALYRPSTALGESMRLQYLKAAHEKSMKMIALGEEGSTAGDVGNAVKVIAAAHPKVIVLGGNPVSNAGFLKAALAAKITAIWIVNSPGMAPDFYNGIGRTAGTVVMSQVFPLNLTLPIISEYDGEMKKIQHDFEPASLEGYLGAAIFVEGLKRAGKDVTTQKFIEALNSMKNFSLGGIDLTYSAEDHSGLSQISFYKITPDGFAFMQNYSAPALRVN